mmetsp:Transcript_44925/g.59632  ORF Transcript_44925/g.59632 Transcript_44925/m.59632 type:complete len:88 (+) Transcript_44925:283-546(+)
MISDGEASQGSAMSQSDDLGLNPTEKRLLEKYDKYPDYIKITFRKPLAYLEQLDSFNSANQYAITKILSKKSKEAILEQAFPLTLYI